MSIRAVQLKSSPSSSRIVIHLTAPAPHRLLFNPGDGEALVELTGVTAEGFSPSGDYFDSLVSGIWVAEPAARAATVRIVLTKEATNVRSFALRQLPGIVIDVERFSMAPQSPVLPLIQDDAASQTASPSQIPAPSQPARVTGRPALPGETFLASPPIVASTTRGAGETGLVELPPLTPPPPPAPSSAPASLPAIGLPPPSANPADFPEETDRFPVRLVEPASPRAHEILQAFSQGHYEDVVKRSWDFFEDQASSADRTDELQTLALAAEARYQYERRGSAPDYEGPLNYYRQLRRLTPEGPLKAFASYRIAQCLEGLGRKTQALDAFRAVSEKRVLPFEEEIGLHVASMQLDAQDYENAEKTLRPLEQAYPHSPLRAKTLERLGDALLGLERWDDCRQSYRDALAADPQLATSPEFLTLRLAQAEEALGHQEESQRLFAQVAECTPADAQASEAIDRARLHVAAFRAGDGYLQHRVEDDQVQHAMLDLVELTRRRVGQPIGARATVELTLLGLRHRAANAYLTAWDDVPAYHAPAQLLPSLRAQLGEPRLAMQLSRELLGMARRNMRQGDLDEIGGAILEALALAAGRASEGAPEIRQEAAALLAEALQGYYEANRPFEGVRLFSRAFHYAPREGLPPLCAYYGALCYLGLGAPAEALSHLNQLANAGPESPVPPDAVQLHLAEAEALEARQNGQSPAVARDRLQKLLQSYPDSPLRSRALLLLGQCLARDGQVETAAQALEQALRAPGLPPAQQIQGFLSLGDAQANLGQAAQAVDSYMRGLYAFEDQRAPFSESEAARALLYGLAENLFRQGDCAKAALMFEQFLTFYPNDPLAGSARYFLGECQKGSGDLGGAKDSYAKLKGDPQAHSPWRELADQRLRDLAIAAASLRAGLGASSPAGGSALP